MIYSCQTFSLHSPILENIEDDGTLDKTISKYKYLLYGRNDGKSKYSAVELTNAYEIDLVKKRTATSNSLWRAKSLKGNSIYYFTVISDYGAGNFIAEYTNSKANDKGELDVEIVKGMHFGANGVTFIYDAEMVKKQLETSIFTRKYKDHVSYNKQYGSLSFDEHACTYYAEDIVNFFKDFPDDKQKRVWFSKIQLTNDYSEVKKVIDKK